MICQLVKVAHTKLSSPSSLQHPGRLVCVAWKLDCGILKNQCLREGSSVSGVCGLFNGTLFFYEVTIRHRLVRRMWARNTTLFFLEAVVQWRLVHFSLVLLRMVI